MATALQGASSYLGENSIGNDAGDADSTGDQRQSSQLPFIPCDPVILSVCRHLFRGHNSLSIEPAAPINVFTVYVILVQHLEVREQRACQPHSYIGVRCNSSNIPLETETGKLMASSVLRADGQSAQVS